jgi:FKBP-type peptidyl-prolyl cis-trans isomerase
MTIFNLTLNAQKIMKFNLMSRRWLLLAVLPLFFSSCLDYEASEQEKQIEFEEELIKSHLTQNNISATRDNSGIYYQVVEKNEQGTPVEAEDVVSIRYVMRTLGGNLIDSLSASQQADTVVRFQHIGGGVYPEGINLGVRLMNEGEKFRFYIPSYRAFNTFSYKTILPSESILVVDAEVVDVETIDEVKTQEKQAIQSYISTHNLQGVSEKTSGIFYQKIEEGSGEVVKAGQQVELAYKGYFLNNEVFDQSKANEPIKFTIGYNSVIKGFEDGIKLMKKGEKGRIFIPSHLAYGSGVQVIPGIVRKDFIKAYNMRDMAPFATLVFDVELEDID